jgi:hypothetical protein
MNETEVDLLKMFRNYSQENSSLFKELLEGLCINRCNIVLYISNHDIEVLTISILTPAYKPELQP